MGVIASPPQAGEAISSIMKPMNSRLLRVLRVLTMTQLSGFLRRLPEMGRVKKKRRIIRLRAPASVFPKASYGENR